MHLIAMKRIKWKRWCMILLNASHQEGLEGEREKERDKGERRERVVEGERDGEREV